MAVIGVACIAVLAWRRGERRYRQLIEHMPQTAIVLFDRELRFQLVAGPAISYAGFDPARIEGRTIFDILPDTQAQALALQLEAALRGESRSLEHHLVPQGRDYWIRVAPVTDAEDRVTGGLALILDITDRRRAGLEIAQDAADVDIVTQATRSLARSVDPTTARISVCEAARRVADAPVAALLEPEADGLSLEVTAAAGAELGGLKVPLNGEGAAAARAFTRAEEVFVARGEGDGEADRALMRRVRASALLYHPVIRDRAAIGVLAVAWREPIAGVSLRLSALIDLLGAEAAVAIGRTELLDRLERLARTDDLTGLPNRRAWQETLPRELARAEREGRPLCVAMLDLDRFKSYNDLRGHLAGDRLLREAAAAWREILRPYDVLARYGGEEFSVLLPSCSLDDALSLVERLRSVTPEGESCSAGVAEWDGEQQPEALVGRADAALYEAKRAGRDRTVAANSG